MKLIVRVMVLLGATFICAGTLLAQSGLPVTGTPPFVSFSGNPEAIDLGNLNIHVTIPVLHKPGRGIPFSFDLNYDSSVLADNFTGGYYEWQPVPSRSPYGTSSALGAFGWYFQPLGYVQFQGSVIRWCSGYTGYIMQMSFVYYDGKGTSHGFPGYVTSYWGTCGNSISGSPGVAMDGSGYTLNLTFGTCSGIACVTGATVIDRHGVQTSFTPTQQGTFAAVVSTDDNGNQISSNRTTGVFTDTLGQSIFTVAGSGTPSSPVTLTYTDSNGHADVYTVKYTSYTIKTNFGCPNSPEYGPVAANLVSEIDLPDQATNPSDRYTFAYEVTPGYSSDVTARIASLTLPTGGTINYAYTGGSDGVLCSAGQQTGSPAELTRKTPDGTWTYSRAVPSPYTSVTTTATDPLGDQTVATFAVSAIPSLFPLSFAESEQQIYSPSATLLETVYTCYNGNTPPCTGAFTDVTESSVFTEWTNGQESETNTTYDGHGSEPYPGTDFPISYGLVTENDDYDYGNGAPGALLRKTTTSYASLGNNIVDRPAQVSVYDGSSNLKAQTNYTYDGSSLVSSGITTQHISVSGSRGNPTTVSRLVSGSTYVNQTATYFDTGMVNVAYDGNNNPTTYSYSSTYLGAYPTSVMNALNQTTTSTYDINTGLLLTTTDPNSLTTSYTYDGMLRPLTISYPDGGETTYSYPSPNQENLSQKIDSSHNRTGSLLVDGLGRQIQQIVSNGETIPYDQTDTCYDALGRTGFASYPYQGNGLSGSPCPSSNAGDTLAYDPLNRTTKVTHSDNSYISTSYSGNCATVTDEAGKTRESCSDGAGRLTQVVENPGGLNYTTTYTYDALDDLTGVTQAGSRQRTFTYDSLSRLTSSINPEANWSPTNQTYIATTYSYDADGNLVSEVEPAQNQTGTSTVTLSYCYDALNRMTSKAYTLQSCPMSSPVATFSYDQSNCLGQSTCYNIGRRTGTTDAAGTEAWAYDKMGRAIVEDQCTATNCGSSTWATTYQYNFLGEITLYTKPTGVQFTYGVNLGGRVNQLTSSLVGSYYPATLIGGVHYNASGDLISATFGNGLTETSAYNPRVQPCRMNLNSSSTTLSSCTAATPSGNVLDLTAGFNFGSGDNGNVSTWSAVGQQTFSRSYSYDALNRIATMSAPGSGCSGLSWTYDAWGNRTDQTVTGGSCFVFHQSVDNNNRINGSPYTYDTTGNMIHDASHSYTYDAENHLTQVDGGSTGTYAYDGDGNRVRKTVGGTITNYVYGLSVEVQVEYGNCQTCSNVGYMYLNGALAALYANSTTYFVHQDHLGSTRLVTAYPTPSIAECDDYYPFGESISCGPSLITHKFTGKERDSESNLDNFGARYDSSALGRFMSPDPEGNYFADGANPQSWNMYSYVMNNPLTFTDPTGMECVWDDGSFDAEGDPQTGSVSSCQNAGGTWVELGQNGNWSGQANTDLQNLVSDIQNGNVDSVTANAPDGSQYTTNYNSSGQVTQTITPNGSVLYGYGTPGSTPSNAGLGLAAVGEGACLVLEPCGAGEATGAAVFGGIFLGTVATIDTYRYFSKGGKEQRQIKEVAREKGVDARKLGDAVEKAKKQEGRGGADNLSLDEIRQIADEMKSGGWWGNK